MLNFHKDHKNLVLTAFFTFLGLSLIIAVFPAFQMQAVEPLTGQPAMSEAEIKGLGVYISEGCVACHTQQVRNIAMDEVWGSRPSVPADFAVSKKRYDVWRQSPSVLGSERTGPDLTNIGKRQPSDTWHLMHLFNPRSVVSASVMPSYPWLFTQKKEGEVTSDDVVVSLPEKYYNREGYKVVATEKALDLVEYLKSLKQHDLSGEEKGEDFIPSISSGSTGGNVDLAEDTSNKLNGSKLYAQTCAVCHQDNGAGIPGAFPPLAGSDIVNNASPEKLITIIIEGYSELPEYAPMPPFGDMLTDEEIAAIATHERSSWGNNAPAVSVEEVEKIREFLKGQ